MVSASLASEIWPDLEYSTVTLHHTAVSARPIQFYMPKLVISIGSCFLLRGARLS